MLREPPLPSLNHAIWRKEGGEILGARRAACELSLVYVCISVPMLNYIKSICLCFVPAMCVLHKGVTAP